MPAIDDQINALLHAYEFGALTPEEHAILMDAALDNPDVFDQLWHATRNREHLNASNVRQKLAAACLQPEPSRNWFSSWQLRLGLPLAAASALGVFLLLRTGETVTAPGPKMVPMNAPGVKSAPLSDAAVLLASPAPSRPIPGLRIDDLPGRIRLSAKVPAGATLFVLRILPGRGPELLSSAGQFPVFFDKSSGPLQTGEVEFRVYLSPSGAALQAAPADPALQMQLFRFPLN
jgi:hypothetical protein